MANILDELATYLAANGVGTVETDIFEGLMPDSPEAPDAVVALFEYPGGPPTAVNTVEPRAIQVRTRALTYDAAKDKAELVYGLLHSMHERQLSGTRFLLVLAKQAPFSLGRDARQRHEFAVNFRVFYDNQARATPA